MTRSAKVAEGLLAVLLLVSCSSTPKTEPIERPAVSSSKPVATAAPAKPAAPVVVPKDPGEQFELALANMKAKKFAEAREGFATLAKEHPEFSGPLTNLGILDAKSNPTTAIGSFSRAVAVNPRNAIAYNWLGILYRESRDYGRAEQSYLKAIALNPDNAGYVLNLAVLYDVYLKRLPEALSRYRDYQRMTNSRELKVAAWIKALETAGVAVAAPTAVSPVPAVAVPVAAPAKSDKTAKSAKAKSK